MFRIIIFSLLYTFVQLEPVHYADCGSVKGKIQSLSLSPCPTDPCYLKKGENMSLALGFVSNENAPKLTSVIHGILAGVPVPFPLANPDGCVDSGITCPLVSSQSYTYTSILPVLDQYPSIKLIVKWELKDENTDDVFCFAVPVEIGK